MKQLTAARLIELLAGELLAALPPQDVAVLD
jgi:hypothetical protein